MTLPQLFDELVKATAFHWGEEELSADERFWVQEIVNHPDNPFEKTVEGFIEGCWTIGYQYLLSGLN